MEGPENRTCQKNAKWSGKTTICQDNSGYCSDPGIPIGAIKTGTSYGIEKKVKYTCSQGLIMFGSKERECLESKHWSGSEPACRQWYTYDTPEEVADSFSSSMLQSIDTTNSQDREDRKVQILKYGLMNIFIVLDTSKSVEEKDFITAKESSKIFIQKVANYDIKPRYCIISFASNAINVVALRDENNKNDDDVMDKLTQFEYSSHEDKQGTNTGAALKSIYEQLIEQELWYKNRGDKESFMKTQNVILLMTDGNYNMGGDPRVIMTKIQDLLDIGKRKEDMREEFLDVYVFGLGSDINQPEINDLASKKANEVHVFHLEDVDKMKECFDQMIDESDVMDTCGLAKYYAVKKDEENIPEMYPWIANISITRSGQVQSCKGTILSPRFILTAAHCFELNEPVHTIGVQIYGPPRKDNKPELKAYKVENFYRHPDYIPESKKDKGIKRSFDHDVALLELKSKIEFTRTARPICIPCTVGTSQALKNPQATTCSTHENLLLSGEEVKAMFIADMEEAEVFIKNGIKRLGCLDAAKKAPDLKDVKNIEDAVTDQFLCTGGIEPQVELPTCKGDSGGPLIVQYKKRFIQVGIISWGTINHCEDGKRINQTEKYNRDFYQSIFKVWSWIKTILNMKNEGVEFLSN
ncbi:hypothetical protein GDO86_015629 [Hymenochirus boettgeri]|nr:hypothetical protein GDO86_015629 [Hymenochirus boettgeri]